MFMKHEAVDGKQLNEFFLKIQLKSNILKLKDTIEQPKNIRLFTTCFSTKLSTILKGYFYCSNRAENVNFLFTNFTQVI